MCQHPVIIIVTRFCANSIQYKNKSIEQKKTANKNGENTTLTCFMVIISFVIIHVFVHVAYIIIVVFGGIILIIDLFA